MSTNFKNVQVSNEYERCRKRLEHEQFFLVDDGIGVEDALLAHFLIADYFVGQGEGIGGIGPKSDSLLISAVGRQFAEYEANRKWTDRFDVTASLIFGMIKNHPFYDANKRTAFLCCLYLLKSDKRVPSVSHKIFEDFIVEIAEDALGRYNGDCEVSDLTEDPEVRVISWFLRRNTRHLETSSVDITYNDLNSILNTFGYDLDKPKNNFIDVVKVKNRQRVCQVAFPGWKNEVDRNALKHVRARCGLTSQEGYDNRVFFMGEADLTSLIEQYAEPLRNLASR